MKSIVRTAVVSIMLSLVAGACTKLNTKVYDSVPVTNFWRTPDEIAAGAAPAYAGLRNMVDMFNNYPLLECSTDEVIVPTRGKDWTDGGMWEQMWKHTWTPNHPQIQSFWEFIYGGISGVNAILTTVNKINPQPANLASINAELKTTRAFYTFLALDLFGNVPIDSSYNIADSLQLCTKSRSAVFAFVEKELKTNLSALSKNVDQITYGRATQWFAYALLAKLYLNAQVYTGTARWSDCIDACDSILYSNNYSLEPNFFDNFSIANEKSKENIFVIPFDIGANLGYFWVQSATLHGDSWRTFGLDAGGANGFCSRKEYLDLFDSNDVRKKMFLVGQQYLNQTQYVYQTGSSTDLQIDPDTNLPLYFDPEITVFSNPDAAFTMAGARCAKWEFNKIGGGLMSNDFAVFRLADIILMKAEAQFRNGDNAGALNTINQKINGVSIRSRANLPDFTSSEMTPDGLLAERARELSWEGWRRNDMIRLGHFTDARVPEKLTSGEYRKLYPIPQNEIDKNPCLTQNPGY